MLMEKTRSELCSRLLEDIERELDDVESTADLDEEDIDVVDVPNAYYLVIKL